MFNLEMSSLKRKVNQLFIFFFFLIILFYLPSCSDNKVDREDHIETYPVFKTTTTNISSYVSYPTQIQGTEEVEIRSKISGYISKVFIDEGDYVKKNQLLFKIEANTLEQDAFAAEAAIKTAEAKVNQAEIEIEKLEPLVERDIISNVELRTAKANLASLKAQLNQAKSTYKSIVVNKDYTYIKSPTSGFIGRLNLKVGALVSPNDANPLSTISDTKNIHAYFSMNEDNLYDLIKGLNGNTLDDKINFLPKVYFEASNGEIYNKQGALNATSGKIESKTGAIQLRALFDNSEYSLLSGSSGKIRIPVYYSNVITIPMSSTFDLQGQKCVYVLSKDNILIAKSVEVLDQVERQYIIGEGLNSGEIILAEGVNKVRPNMVIKPNYVDMSNIILSFNTVFK
ncbi:efflux RND transporter periplasmic adaptor subunit [Flammeovirga pectinis]|uniref:Efflux RND transporter periplasmic adaptor subunit n=1 Tax=Flammeovirga pectinis TaxID=2494373 RepID=A0A3S9PBB9_9BACT|nr:efflux RND transporter periplasmic adaptor subunit [Flammeovirga pectinis]AZQ65531.1 efflux RND transporter periplasmic adaptor subunit [Flammeovirga pectinis]